MLTYAFECLKEDKYKYCGSEDFKDAGDLFAEILNVKTNTYSKWENCINDMSIEKCNDLANYYHTTMDYMLGLSNIKIVINNITPIFLLFIISSLFTLIFFTQPHNHLD